MSFSVADLLALPAMEHARAEVVCGDRLDRLPVRWVHTSEIYEISPLLKGGEVLLTTGLGLIAVTPSARRAYIAALAQVGVVALVLELGRTFVAVPDELVSEARKVGLPLVLLHGVVPFIEVTEAAHTHILGEELVALRISSSIGEKLLHAFGQCNGLVAFIGAISEIAGCHVALYTASGELIAGSTAEDIVTGTELSVPIMVSGELWGQLVLGADGSGADGAGTGSEPGASTATKAAVEWRRNVLAAAAPLVAAEVQRSGAAGLSRMHAGAELLRDMASGQHLSSGELTSRALGVGLVARPSQQIVALCIRARVAGTTTANVLVPAREVASRVYGASLVAEHEGDVLIAAVTGSMNVRSTLARFADELMQELPASLRDSVIVSAGSAVEDAPSLVRALSSARETARMAVRLVPSSTVVLAADFALYQLLISLVDDEALQQFVNNQLGALLAHDARTGTNLVVTLDAYLAAGLSKTRAAAVLAIRRQTLYARLERIGELLDGLDLSNRERRTALDLALVSWRLRLSATRSSVL